MIEGYMEAKDWALDHGLCYSFKLEGRIFCDEDEQRAVIVILWA